VNPPYSVKGFLETLTSADREAFSVTEGLDANGIVSSSSIEAFFVERARQLLAPGGVAAVILPSSILSAGGASYVRAREIILKDFDTVAVCELGTGTFAKTKMHTAALFLRRRAGGPSPAEHYGNRIDSWFAGDFSQDNVFGDSELLDEYCVHVGPDTKKYRNFLISGPGSAENVTEIFWAYRENFERSPETRLLRNRKSFGKLDAERRDGLVDIAFGGYVRRIEREKMYYFILAHVNPQPVVVVKCPHELADSKKFLGYEWSAARGSEGIRYLGAKSGGEDGRPGQGGTGYRSPDPDGAGDVIVTPLFNPADLEDPDRINSIIRANFGGKGTGKSEHVVLRRLVDMLDFTGPWGEKAIFLCGGEERPRSGRHPLAALGDVCRRDQVPARGLGLPYVGINDIGLDGTISGAVLTREVSPETRSYLFSERHVLCPRMLDSWNRVSVPGFTGRCSRLLLPVEVGDRAGRHYVLQFLRDPDTVASLRDARVGTRSPLADFGRLMKFMIPLPPLAEQKALADDCAHLDRELARAREAASVAEEERELALQVLGSRDGASAQWSLGDAGSFALSVGRRVILRDLDTGGGVPLYSANVHEPAGFMKERPEDDFGSPSVLWGLDGGWKVAYVPSGVEFHPTDHCGVARVRTPEVEPRCLAWALEQAGAARGFSRQTRASLERVKRLNVRLPPIEKQRETAAKAKKLDSRIESLKQVIRDMEDGRQKLLRKYLD
jgi:hypothetical protein